MSALLPLVGAVGSVLGSAYNSYQNRKSVDSTNQMNLQIARETNQANKDLYQQQFQDQLKMQQMQNEYNSASAQVQRLRQAGLNPALTFGASSSVAPLSVPSAHPAQTGAPMQPSLTNYSDSPVSAAISAVSSISESLKNNAEASGIRTDNQYREELLQQQLAESRQRIHEGAERVKNSKADRRVKAAQVRKLVQEEINLDLLNEITKSSQGELSKSAELQNRHLQTQIELLREQSVSERERQLTEQLSRSLSIAANSRAEREVASIISSNFASAQMMASQGRLNDAQVNSFAVNLTHQILQNHLLGAQVAQARFNLGKDIDLYPIIKDQVYGTLQQMKSDYNNPFKYVGNVFGSSINYKIP